MFKDQLMELVNAVEGALGAVIMGMDGISVDEFCKPPEADLQVIGIEFSSIVKEMTKASHSMEAGSIGEIMMVTDQKTVIVRKINEEYFVALVLNGTGNLGKGRFKLRMMIPHMSKEFE